MISALLLAAAVAPPPEPDAVARIEAAYTAPPGAHDARAYVRWYWSDPDPDVVDGVYLAPATAARFPGGSDGPVHIVTAERAPRIMDGGCGVVHVRSRRPFDVVEAHCGGR